MKRKVDQLEDSTGNIGNKRSRISRDQANRRGMMNTVAAAATTAN